MKLLLSYHHLLNQHPTHLTRLPVSSMVGLKSLISMSLKLRLLILELQTQILQLLITLVEYLSSMFLVLSQILVQLELSHFTMGV